MNKYTKKGKECYENVRLDTPFADLLFHAVEAYGEDSEQVALHTNLGTLTVLDRMTGFGYRDTETGYRDADGKFWLASGGYDVRNCGAATMEEAILWVKKNARCSPAHLF